MRTYYIHESNLERLQKKINRIRTKCEKYGCDFHYAEIGEEFRVMNEGEENEHVERFVLVEAEGTAKVNGWRFAATIERTEHGNLINSVIDVEIPQRYFDCELECEHCHSRRHRANTYLIYNEETNEFKQVGSTCLCDFTGGLSAESAAAYIELFESMMEFEAPLPGAHMKEYFYVEDMLLYAVQFVKEIGYASSYETSYGSTKERVLQAYEYDHGHPTKYVREFVEEYRAKYHPVYDSKENKDRVADIIFYFTNMDPDSSYLNNCHIIAQSTYVGYSSIGYLVSMVPTYMKAMELEMKKAEQKAQLEKEIKDSNFVGSVGDRLTIKGGSIDAITSWENMYGVTIRYKITDESGNVYMWDSSTGICIDREVDTITGTVKKHDEFRGVKQTWLTRCRVNYKPIVTKAKEAPSSTFSLDELFETFDDFVE